MAQTTWLLAEGLMEAGDDEILWEAASAADLARIDVAGLVPVTLFECESRADLVHLRLALDDDVDIATDKGGYFILLTPGANVRAARDAWRRTVEGRGIERAMKWVGIFCADRAAFRRLRAEVASRAHLFRHAPTLRI